MTNAVEERVILRNGYWHNGTCRREVRVRAVGEDDESLVDELSAAALPLHRDTRLLEHCVLGLEQERGVRQLSLGDREALLLHARRLTFGGLIDCVLRCPECGERMDFQLPIDRVLLPWEERAPARHFEETLEAGDERVRVRFRRVHLRLHPAQIRLRLLQPRNVRVGLHQIGQRVGIVRRRRHPLAAAHLSLHPVHARRHCPQIR